MKLITVSRAKELLRISTAAYDTFLNVAVPILQNELIAYLNNFFYDKIGTHFSSGITFATTGRTITSETPYVLFHPNKVIYIRNSISNDGFYKIKTVSEYILTLNDDETLVDEESGSDYEIDMYTVKIPSEIELVLADLLKAIIDGFPKESGLTKTSESIGGGDYSVSYLSSFPEDKKLHYFSRLNRYRKTRKG